jgi:hypothetical protein
MYVGWTELLEISAGILEKSIGARNGVGLYTVGVPARQVT